MTPDPVLLAAAGAAVVVAIVVLVALVLVLGRTPGGGTPSSSPEAKAVVPAGAPPDRTVAQVEIAELLRAGRKIEAIKRYREVTGLGLAEAKNAVEALERGASLPLPGAGAPATAPPAASAGSMAEVERLVRENQLIAAIKLYRELTGVGLKEAKDAVEAIRDRRV